MTAQKELMTPEAIEWLGQHGYPRTPQWLRMMVHAGHVKSELRHGRSFFKISELRAIVKEKKRLKVSVS